MNGVTDGDVNANLKDQLVGLYAELAALTRIECAGHCARPQTCCEERYCAAAIDFAKSHWQIELQPTWHAALPLMGDDGCTAAPHLRPICSAHTCEICAYGAKRGDARWTERYYSLLSAIAEIEPIAFEDEGWRKTAL